MDIVSKLKNESRSVESLTSFLNSNIDDVFSFAVNTQQSKLVELFDDINHLFSESYSIIRSLDFDVAENQMYLDLLLQLTERLNTSFYFKRFFSLKEGNNLRINSKNKATSLYINNLRTLNEYISITDEVLNNLDIAFKEEEDNEKGVLGVFFNFYIHVIDTFLKHNHIGVGKFIDQINSKTNKYPFLNAPVVEEILELKVFELHEDFYDVIQNKIDNYFDRIDVIPVFNSNLFLIENEGEYANRLGLIDKNIYSIRELSSQLFNKYNEVFYSLGRGVAVLTQEQQLFAYLYSYGKMHFEKCNYAYQRLYNSDNEFYTKQLEVIDWGCGQALASMTYLNFLKKHNPNQNINKVFLNEPSEIALKRGALHLRKFDENLNITTINKDLDSISQLDFSDINSSKVKLHLFSNILDIDGYSTKKLIELVMNSFTGENYFIIVSPFVTDLKTNRINNFVSEFKDLESFKFLVKEDKRSGYWKGNWTIVLRIFKVVI